MIWLRPTKLKPSTGSQTRVWNCVCSSLSHANDLGLNADIGSNFLDIELSVRGNTRRVLKFLHCLGSIVPDPEGEGCLHQR